MRGPSRLSLQVWVCLLLGLACGGPAWAQPPAAVPPQVLMLVSYHVGMPWSDAQVAGLRAQLAGQVPEPELLLNFLDTKRVAPSEVYYAQMEALLLTKYGTAAPALMVSVDDDALDFALRLRRHRFPHTPIVFSGVASSRRAALVSEPALGGVFDDLDVADSLARLLALMPQVRRVVMVHDQSRTSLAQVETLRAAAPAQVVMDALTDLPVPAVEARLRALGATDLVLALPFNRDAQGRLLSHEEAASLWAAASQAPVVVTRDVAMQPGVLGGFLVSGTDQGRAAGRLAARLLQGAPAHTLPLLEASARATFEYSQLLRWGLSVHRLPADAVVLNRPPDSLDSLRPHLPWLSVVFGSLLLIIGMLLYTMRVRRNAELALRQSARHYQALFDNSPDAILVRDMATGQLVQTNTRFGQMFGYPPDLVRDLSPATLSLGVSPYGADEAQAWYERCLREGPQIFEWRSRRRDGSLFWSEISMSRFDLAPGQRLVATVRDITDRKLAETQRREYEHNLKQVYQNLPVAVFALDANHCVSFWNLHMTRLTGVQAQAVVGRSDSWRGLYPTPQTSLADALLDGLAPEAVACPGLGPVTPSPEVPGGLEAEVHFPQLNGGQGLWARVSAAPLYGSDGQLKGAIQSLIDVTPLKRSQTVLEALNRELEARVQARTAELQRAMGQLVEAEKLAALGSLVAGIAHELNTPIGNVMAVATTLKDEVAGFSQRLLAGAVRRSDVAQAAARLQEASALIERSAEKAARLVLNFKDIAVDQRSMRRREFVLRTVVDEVVAATQGLFRPGAHRVQVDIDPGLVLDSYPGPLEQVLAQLLNNSVAHGFEHCSQGLVQVRAWREADGVVLDYADNGCGIKTANLPRIFEPFYTTKLGQGGSGLGLYVVYNLVTHVLGGTLSAHSEPGQGTRFVLRLPLSAPDRQNA